MKPNSLGKMVMKHREKMHIGRNVACENVILTKGYAHKGEYARSVNLLILCCCSENLCAAAAAHKIVAEHSVQTDTLLKCPLHNLAAAVHNHCSNI